MVIWDVTVLGCIEMNLYLSGNCSWASVCYSALLFHVPICLLLGVPLPLYFDTVYLRQLPMKAVFPIKVISVMKIFFARLLCSCYSTYFVPELVFFPQ